MIETCADEEFIKEFLLNLRDEDRQEINFLCSCDFEKELCEICLNKDKYTYILKTYDDEPLAIGGAFRIKNTNIARVWLLSTNEVRKYKKELYKYIKNKIEFFKSEFNVLYNYIYKSNFNSLIWLQTCGFNVFDLESDNYKLFYYLKGDMCFDLRYFTC